MGGGGGGGRRGGGGGWSGGGGGGGGGGEARPRTPDHQCYVCLESSQDPIPHLSASVPGGLQHLVSEQLSLGLENVGV